eukprot:TRINITY_DN14526_c0_g1_i2.p1 TRINITY_DN14526_c0_g1~~TRINITY_DN14526_c0_g1_i2.p1  ORF type:complete len:361 (+),score=70.55 TRINITY_DN14526_c0_g1_i2:64-1146(+)
MYSTAVLTVDMHGAEQVGALEETGVCSRDTLPESLVPNWRAGDFYPPEDVYRGVSAAFAIDESVAFCPPVLETSGCRPLAESSNKASGLPSICAEQFHAFQKQPTTLDIHSQLPAAVFDAIHAFFAEQCGEVVKVSSEKCSLKAEVLQKVNGHILHCSVKARVFCCPDYSASSTVIFERRSGDSVAFQQTCCGAARYLIEVFAPADDTLEVVSDDRGLQDSLLSKAPMSLSTNDRLEVMADGIALPDNHLSDADDAPRLTTDVIALPDKDVPDALVSQLHPLLEMLQHGPFLQAEAVAALVSIAITSMPGARLVAIALAQQALSGLWHQCLDSKQSSILYPGLFYMARLLAEVLRAVAVE